MIHCNITARAVFVSDGVNGGSLEDVHWTHYPVVGFDFGRTYVLHHKGIRDLDEVEDIGGLNLLGVYEVSSDAKKADDKIASIVMDTHLEQLKKNIESSRKESDAFRN